MVKRVDVAVEDAFRSVMEGTWEPGIKVLGLSEDGVAWALDEHNRALVTADMEERMRSAEKLITSGEIAVADYTANNACTY